VRHTLAALLFAVGLLSGYAAGAAASRERPLPELSVVSPSDEQGHWGLYETRADGRRLGWIARGLRPGAACWSPDGRRLAITRADGTLGVLDVATHRIDRPRVGRGWYCSSWSPDGRFLLAGAPSFNGDASVRLLVVQPGTRRLYVRSFSPGSGATSPVWSPDSTAIAYVRLGRAGNEEHLADVRGTPRLWRVADRGSVALGPASFHASRLLWTRPAVLTALTFAPRVTGPNVFTISRLRLMTNRIVHVGHGSSAFSWGPLLAESRRGDLAWACGDVICVEQATASAPVRVAPRQPFRPRQLEYGGYDGLAWSPSGLTLAFEARPQTDTSRIFLVDRAGRDLRTLNAKPQGDNEGQPVWSPDGRFVAFRAGLDRDQTGVYVVRAGSTPAGQAADNADCPLCSWDGDFFWRPVQR
jgi:Tol biopolymer transport system component